MRSNNGKQVGPRRTAAGGLVRARDNVGVLATTRTFVYSDKAALLLWLAEAEKPAAGEESLTRRIILFIVL